MNAPMQGLDRTTPVPPGSGVVGARVQVSSVTLFQLSGVAVMIGMTVFGVGSFLTGRGSGVAEYLNPFVRPDDLAKLFGSLIFLIGLPGLYAFQAVRAGWLGLAGFLLTFFGIAILEVSTEVTFAFVGPMLAAHHQTQFLLQGGLEPNLGKGFLAYFMPSVLATPLGFIAFGIATFRARVYPRWAAVLIGIGEVATIVMGPLKSVPSGPFRLDRIGILATALGFAWCGWRLLRQAAADTALTPSQRAGVNTGMHVAAGSLTLMRIVAALAGLFFLATIPQAISPWGALHFGTGVRALPLHRWHAALAGGPDLGSAALLFYLAWRPLRAPVALQSFAIGVLVFLGANGPFVPRFFTWAWIAVPVILVLALYPRRRELLSPPWSVGVNWPLFGMGLLVAIFLLPDAAQAFAAQIRHPGDVNWASNAEHLIHLSVIAVLAGMSRPGARVLGIVAGAVLAFLGAAAITVPGDPGSWGTVWGGLAIAAGLGIAATAAYEWRRRGEPLGSMTGSTAGAVGEPVAL